MAGYVVLHFLVLTPGRPSCALLNTYSYRLAETFEAILAMHIAFLAHRAVIGAFVGATIPNPLNSGSQITVNPLSPPQAGETQLSLSALRWISMRSSGEDQAPAIRHYEPPQLHPQKLQPLIKGRELTLASGLSPSGSKSKDHSCPLSGRKPSLSIGILTMDECWPRLWIMLAAPPSYMSLRVLSALANPARRAVAEMRARYRTMIDADGLLSTCWLLQ